MKAWPRGALALAALLWAAPLPAGAQDAGAVDDAAIRRGEYLFHAGGCAGCHTDVKNKGPVGAGGRAIPTPFGTFYGPNITPDREFGIGGWSKDDFRRALRDGVRPDRRSYFPVFPYTSFTKIVDNDASDLWAYLRSLPPAARANKPHDVTFPFNLRFMQHFWKVLFFASGPFQADPARSAEINRGAYLTQALGHCGECHTPRNLFGGAKALRALAGTPDGPEGAQVPNITPDAATGIGKWSRADFDDLLAQGMTPDGDFVGATMAEVVRETTSNLSQSDRKAMIAYLRSLPPIQNQVRKTPR